MTPRSHPNPSNRALSLRHLEKQTVTIVLEFLATAGLSWAAGLGIGHLVWGDR